MSELSKESESLLVGNDNIMIPHFLQRLEEFSWVVNTQEEEKGSKLLFAKIILANKSSVQSKSW